jgi:hypothetical protein
VRNFFTSLLIAFCLLPISGYGSALTWFSRANCGVPFPFTPTTGLFFDESIAWTGIDGPSWTLWTFSHHNLNGYALQDQSNWLDYHYNDSGAETTWRSYAGHTKSSSVPGYYVHGEHYLYDPWYGWYFMGFTLATSCNITEW